MTSRGALPGTEGASAMGTVQTRVVAVLRQEILGGLLSPGTRLRQTDIANRLGVSTTPVREALRELASEGLLDEKPHRGFVVRTPSPEELLEVYELRMVIEPLNIRDAVRHITPSELEAAKRLVDQMNSEDDGAAWVELNREFHKILMDASRRKRTIEVLEVLQNIAALYVGVFAHEAGEQLAAANEEHRNLLRAIEQRDEEQAVELTAVHLRRSVDVVLGVLKDEGVGVSD